MCAFKDPFGSETVFDSWYNQRVWFFISLRSWLSPAARWAGLSSPAGCPSRALPDHPSGLCWWGHPGCDMLCLASVVPRSHPDPMEWPAYVGLSCYWRLTVILGVFAVSMSKGRLWDRRSLIVQKCLPTQQLFFSHVRKPFQREGSRRMP